MNEIKSGRLDKDHIKAENSRSSPLFSAVPPEDAKRTWDVPHSSSLHSVIGHLSTSGTSTGQSPLRFIACKSMPVCPSFQDTGCLKNVEPIISTGMFVGRTSVSYPVGNPVRADGSVNANLGFQVSLKDFFINSVDGRTNCGSSWNEKGPLTNDSGAGKEGCNKNTPQCPFFFCDSSCVFADSIPSFIIVGGAPPPHVWSNLLYIKITSVCCTLWIKYTFYFVFFSFFEEANYINLLIFRK